MRFDSITRFIDRYESFILTGHETPDADAIGSEVALCYALRERNKSVMIINADPTPRIFEFIDERNDIICLSDNPELPENPEERALIVLDTNDLNNTGDVGKQADSTVAEYFIIDHHEQEGSIRTGNLIEDDASSTCEIVFDLIEDLGIELDLVAARALYAGIVYDTGSFIYPKTTAKTLGIAMKLVEIGVKPNSIYRNMYESNSISALKLQSRVLASLELHFENQVAVQMMLKSTLMECDAAYEEGQTLINVPLKSRSVCVSVFFKENLSGVLRCSLRSKGNIDVASIAQYYRGGGHRTAAGFKSVYPLEEIKAKVLDMLKSMIYEQTKR